MAVLCRHWLPLRRACSRACQSATRLMSISRLPQVCAASLLHLFCGSSVNHAGACKQAQSRRRHVHSHRHKAQMPFLAAMPHRAFVVVTGLLGGSALLDFALALERQIQSACFGALALPSAAVDPDSQSFFAAPRNKMVSCPHILPLS